MTKAIRKQLQITDSVAEIIAKMGENDEYGLCIIDELMDETEGSVTILRILNDMNIRGQQIYTAYKYYCNENIDTFIAAIRRRDPDMVESVNMHVSSELTDKAVLGGEYEPIVVSEGC